MPKRKCALTLFVTSILIVTLLYACGSLNLKTLHGITFLKMIVRKLALFKHSHFTRTLLATVREMFLAIVLMGIGLFFNTALRELCFPPLIKATLKQ